jgi:hypothetical protein
MGKKISLVTCGNHFIGLKRSNSIGFLQRTPITPKGELFMGKALLRSVLTALIPACFAAPSYARLMNDTPQLLSAGVL